MKTKINSQNSIKMNATLIAIGGGKAKPGLRMPVILLAAAFLLPGAAPEVLAQTDISGQSYVGSTKSGNGGSTFSGNYVSGSNVLFASNTSTGGSGGAMYFSGTMFLYSGTFDNNTSSSQGGAIRLRNNGLLNFTNVLFSNNQSTTNYGGAIGMTDASPQLILVSSTFLNNSTLVSGNAGRGGAIIVNQSSGDAVFMGTNLWFQGNYSTLSDGGALYNTANTAANFNLNGAYFISNTAGNNGGALYMNKAGTIISATFVGNVAGQAGGGLYVNDSSITLDSDFIFTSNTASSGNGGGANISSAASLQDITFSSRAIFQNNLASASGGGIALGANRSVTFRDEVLFKGNNAVGSNGGGLSMDSQGIIMNNATGKTLTFTNNVAGGAGGALYGGSGSAALLVNAPTSAVVFKQNAAASDGGAVRMASEVSITGVSIEFSGNQAGGGGGALSLGANDGAAGVPAYRVALNAPALFKDNSALSTGGGAIATGGDSTTVNNIRVSGSSSFINNYAAGSGGAFYITGTSSTVSLDASTGDINFANNKAGVTFAGMLDAPALALIASGSNGFVSAVADTGSGNDIHFAHGGASLILDTAAGRAISFGGGITAGDPLTAITVTKNGAGTVVFDGAPSSAMTNTQVNAGIFKLINNAVYGNGGTLTLAGAAVTLSVSGTLHETVIGNDGKIAVGDLNSGVAQTFALTKDLSVNNATLSFDLLGGDGVSDPHDKLLVTGSVTAAGVNKIDVTGLGTGVYKIVTTGSGIAGTDGNFTLYVNGGAMTSRNAGSTLAIVGNELVLTGTMVNLETTWGATAGRLWQDSVGASWVATTDSAEKFFRNGDRVIFGATGSGTVSIFDAGVVVSEMKIEGASDYTFTGSGGITGSKNAVDTTLASPSGKLIKNGTGVLAFANTAANQFDGGIEINAGAIAFSDGAQLGVTGTAITFAGSGSLRATADTTLAGAIAIGAGNAATVDTNGRTVTYSGALTAAAGGTLTKTGAGALSITTDNSGFTGATTIQLGAINLASATSKLGGAVTINNTAVVSGIGAFTGVVTASAGSIIQPGLDSVTSGTLTFATLNLNNAKLQFDLFDGNVSDRLAVATLNVTGTNIIDVNAPKVGVFDLGNIANYTSAGTKVTIGGQDQVVGARQTASVSGSSNGHLYLTYTADSSRQVKWTGASSAVWNSTITNWAENGSAIMFAAGDRVIFDATGSNRTIALEGSARINTVDMWVQGAADYTITGSTGITADVANVMMDQNALGGVAAAGQLVKEGAGTLTFENTGTNIFKGGIVIKGGTLAFSDASQIDTTGTNISFADNGTLMVKAAALTLSNAISMADGKTGTLDTQSGTVTYAGALSATGTGGTLAKAGTGTLLLTTDNSAYTGKLAINAGEVYTAPGAKIGGVVEVTAARIFGGAGQAATVNALGAANIQVGMPGGTGAETLAITRLNLDTGARIQGSGTLVGAVSLAGSYANIAVDAGKTLFLTATTSGTGMLVTTGSGTVEFAIPASLGHGSTEIRAGVTTLGDAVIASATSIAHKFVLNGGWLDLSDSTFDSTGATANDWARLDISSNVNATTGGVIGSNDKLTLKSSVSVPIGITGTGGKDGLFVVIDPGAGKTVALTGTNTYAGYTMIKSGTLQVSADWQLGSTTLARPVIFAESGSGALSISPTGTTIFNRNLELRGDGIVSVADGGIARWRSIQESGGSHLLTITGQGGLTLLEASAHSGTTLVYGSVTLNLWHGAALGTSLVVAGTEDDNAYITLGVANMHIANAIRLDGDLTIQSFNFSGTLSGALSGYGALEKTGSGALTLLAQNTYRGRTTVTEGTLRSGTAGAIPVGPVGVAAGATLDFNGFAHNITELSNFGTVRLGPSGTTAPLPGNVVTIAGNYLGPVSGTATLLLNIDVDGAGKLVSDRLDIGGYATGNTRIVLMHSGSARYNFPEDQAVDFRGVKFVTIGEGEVAEAFSGYGLEIGGELYQFGDDGSYGLELQPKGYAPTVIATIGLDAAALFVGKAANESLSRRFTALRANDAQSRKKRGFELWLNGLKREDTVRDTIYKDAKSSLQGVQVGGDLIESNGDNIFTLGLFGDYVSGDMKLAGNIAKTESEARGAGIYASARNGPWYLDAMFRFSSDEYTVASDYTAPFDLKGTSYGGSLETGYAFAVAQSGWNVEPQLQLSLHRSNIEDATDSYNRNYTIDTVQSTVGRFGVKAFKTFEWRKNRRITPHIRASIEQEFGGDGSVTVGITRVGGDFGGSTALLDTGVVMQIFGRFDLSADAAYYTGDKYDGYSLNLGARFNW
ncbi:autotransporter outer membrane beta-barrel domain-containing protein [Termitidicoccus mucosus]|uniref:Autotransporter domain-containing protein n=1 Tax=Termitidicoccus mucosus TaxID=1184151 RepID=A0A178INS6_9BACT|nr:hypothetical protein AW736_05675 [Opitutaceae bacterium TSB47]